VSNDWPLCNWQVPIKDEDGDPETDDVGRELSKACNHPAKAVYAKLNPRTEPDQPRWLRYPACPTHDYPSRRKAALDQGFNRETL
jgi:hypothetical protein